MIISKTPLRMSFAGGGSDLRAYYQHGYGAVVSTAINKYIYIMINERFSPRIRVGYSKIEEVDTVDEIEHNLVREAMKMTDVTSNVDIVYMSDMLPAHEGSGLGGSSSIIVGTLHALHAFKHEYVSAEQLGQEACRIEIEILGHPIGKQDQYAAAYGGLNWIQFNADESVYVSPLVCKKETKEQLNKNLMMFYTGSKTSSQEVLPEQKEKTEKNLEVLDRMVELAADLRKSLEQDDLTQFGNILHENWMLKQTLAKKISNPTINALYDKAREAGALGGKILGSGGGGFLLLYVEEENQQNVRDALPDLRETPFKFDGQGSRIIYVGE
jgi:D-glycero-alpha-D-manno-heptose-7-phosphate kinase